MELFPQNTEKFIPLEFDFPQGQIICGIDEAGRGPLAGPLSIALVSFETKTLSQILNKQILIELNDSKLLSHAIREKLYSEIHIHAKTIVHQFVSNKFIDTFGLSESIFMGIKKLILKSNLTKPISLIDGNYNFQKKQSEHNFFFEYKSIIKGDTKIISIAAASIIAKVQRDRFMIVANNKYPNFDFAIHKGYGTRKHIEKIKTLGYSKLHRKSFQIKLIS